MSTDVMTNPKTTTKEKKRISTKVIAQIGVLGAIAMVLMLFDIPLPFTKLISVKFRSLSEHLPWDL